MIETVPVTDFDLRVEPQGWAFAAAEAPRIAAHWRKIAAANPHVWNGAVLICTSAAVRDGRLTARFAATDFASFLAWRDWGWPDGAARNCFGVPVLVSSDQALLFGVMGSRTMNSGRSFPPSGSLEPGDAGPDGTVDILASMRRELLEETGLDFAAATPRQTFAIFEGRRLAVVQAGEVAERYDSLAARAARHIAADPQAELSHVEAIRSRQAISERMPPFAQEIVRRLLPE